MHCEPKVKFGLFGSCFFIGLVISSLIFPSLADSIGRQPITLLGVTIQALSSLCMLFSKSLYFSYALLFIMGIAMAPRFFVGYVYAMEFLP